MANYRINKNAQANGDKEVHKYGCMYYDNLTNYEFLGDFLTCSTAIQEAKNRGYSTADGCKVCIPSCNNS